MHPCNSRNMSRTRRNLFAFVMLVLGSMQVGTKANICREDLPPILLPPRQVCGTFKLYEEIILKVEELFQVGEEKLIRVLVDDTKL